MWRTSLLSHGKILAPDQSDPIKQNVAGVPLLNVVVRKRGMVLPWRSKLHDYRISEEEIALLVR